MNSNETMEKNLFEFVCFIVKCINTRSHTQFNLFIHLQFQTKPIQKPPGPPWPPIACCIGCMILFGASKYLVQQFMKAVFSASLRFSELCFLLMVFSLQVAIILVVIKAWASIASLSIFNLKFINYNHKSSSKYG